MSKLYVTNRKLNNTNKRWETLTGQTSNKENLQNNSQIPIQKAIKKAATVIPLEQKKPIPQRTITKYFKQSNVKKYPNLELKDSKGCIREFACFDDKALNIPPAFNQTITHVNTEQYQESMDNDCQSDDEQVASAVRQLSLFLENSIMQYKHSN